MKCVLYIGRKSDFLLILGKQGESDVGSADLRNKKIEERPTTANLWMTFLDPHSSGFHSVEKYCRWSSQG